jgi:hypothetical protein
VTDARHSQHRRSVEAFALYNADRTWMKENLSEMFD